MPKKHRTEEERKKRRDYMREWYNRPYVRERRQQQGKTRLPERELKAKEYHRLKNYKLRLEILTAYGGDPPRCSCECGCREGRWPLLEIAHLNDDGAHHRRQICGRNYNAGSQYYQRLKNLGFPNDVPLAVRCLVCNVGKHRNGGKCPNLGVYSLEELPAARRVGGIVPASDREGQLLLPFVRELSPKDLRRADLK
jgi:hypothetical protein